jgi:hypothetical protein
MREILGGVKLAKISRSGRPLGSRLFRIFAEQSCDYGFLRNVSAHALRFEMGDIAFVDLRDY